MSSSQHGDASEGLGSRTLLDKVDKLRELGISSMVPLPQMVVVGDQSAGKSSVLESLTGFHFPRAVNLCTRHATEIICRREETESIVVSIHAVDADPEKARKFRREADSLKTKKFAQIFEDAAEVMGIKSGGPAFSRDVLRVEMSGPNEEHLTVIDVPGMFENATPGLTTEDDITLVKSMVKNYIKESRTIILAVIPCNSDIANQKILKLAKEADPEGKRTLGVLTKPDLANQEEATRNVIVDLVKGRRRDLHLGYCVVKNRGADDTNSTLEDRNKQEKIFFNDSPWNKLPSDRVGIPALRHRIQTLLMDRTKSEFPKVRADLSAKLKESKQRLEEMGESRSTTAQQRLYIGKIAADFTRIKNFSLDAYYTRNEIFDRKQDLKLITRVREINELFSKILYAKGHTRSFATIDACIPTQTTDFEVPPEEYEDYEDEETSDVSQGPRDQLYDGEANFSIPLTGEDELDGIISDPFECDDPSTECILSYIGDEYLTSRGYELGTFSSEMLPVTFKEQSKKWPFITKAHVSNAILIVHHFIGQLLEEVCAEAPVREELWNFLLEDLQHCYKRAMDHTDFLLKVEFEGKSMTYNPRFEETLDQTRSQFNKHLQTETTNSTDIISEAVKKLVATLTDKGSLETVRRKIHDVLQSYYGIARDRFVDVVCRQVIDFFLLHPEKGPLAVLSDEVVLRMTPEQLDAIAGEDMESRDRREKLDRDINDLTKALKILRA